MGKPANHTLDNSKTLTVTKVWCNDCKVYLEPVKCVKCGAQGCGNDIDWDNTFDPDDCFCPECLKTLNGSERKA